MNLHDADEYCRQKSVPAGGSFYYSILYYPEHLRRDLRALHALGTEQVFRIIQIGRAHV